MTVSSENIKSFHARGHMGILQIALEVQTFSSNIYRAERNLGRYHGWICELDNWRKALKYKTISKQVIPDSLWGCTLHPVSARNMRNIASLLASIWWESGVEKEKKRKLLDTSAASVVFTGYIMWNTREKDKQWQHMGNKTTTVLHANFLPVWRTEVTKKRKTTNLTTFSND